MEMQSLEFANWFPVLLWGLQLIDLIYLRRDFELWIFNIVETAMIMETLEVGLSVVFIMPCLSMAPTGSYLNKFKGWNAVV